mgnify:CR=1 FL=1
MPEDFSDVGQAEVLSKYFANELRYSPATHFIRYSDHYWQETEPGAQAVAHELTRRQLNESNRLMCEALQKLKNCGAQEILDNTSKTKAEQLMNDEQMKAYQEFLAAKAYQSFAIRRRDSKNITSTLKESHPMLEISPRDLDADCFLLCTPEATYDLRLGCAGAREHSADDFITKITSVSPGVKGTQLWLDNLNLIFSEGSAAHRLCSDDLRPCCNRESFCGGAHHRIRRWAQRQIHLLECHLPRAGTLQWKYIRRYPDRRLPQEHQAGNG